MNRKIKMAIIGMFATVTFASQAGAVGYNVKIQTKNDTLENSGEIIAIQKTMGGAATQKVGLRVHSNASCNYDYQSKGNIYRNSGTIKATQTVSAGVAIQAVGLEVN
ncbi:hypothetical protein [Desulfobacter latus]|uniref:Uncharacterized protein n=1 Tax=Desulfobacter latus TaxID=2292 RepID=A0A850TC85_9BACT|nr:hypothetical protein [Desulfobacter latus]NWH04996.1 hypothetical protein [Desulfobacter latus]